MTHTLSLIIPVFNEEQRIDKFIRTLTRTRFPASIKLEEVIFVDDGSTDQTKNVIKASAHRLKQKHQISVKLISYPDNTGKGHAVKLGMKAAKAEYALLVDVDLSTPLRCVRSFAKAMDHQHPVIIGTRKTGSSTISIPQPIHRQLLGHGFTLLSQTMLNTWVSDFTCGFKAFHRSVRARVFSKVKINRWGYDAELLFVSRLLGYSITEIAVDWQHDSGSKVRVWQDVTSSLVELLQIRWHDMRGAYQATPLSRRTTQATTLIITSLHKTKAGA